MGQALAINGSNSHFTDEEPKTSERETDNLLENVFTFLLLGADTSQQGTWSQ